MIDDPLELLQHHLDRHKKVIRVSMHEVNKDQPLTHIIKIIHPYGNLPLWRIVLSGDYIGLNTLTFNKDKNFQVEEYNWMVVNLENTYKLITILEEAFNQPTPELWDYYNPGNKKDNEATLAMLTSILKNSDIRLVVI